MSHRVLLWPGVLGHMRRLGLAVTVGSDLQIFGAMIFVSRMCCKSDHVGGICKIGGTAGELIESTISSMIQWLEDVKQVDGFADWVMEVLRLAFLN
jgi:hypothetical protein